VDVALRRSCLQAALAGVQDGQGEAAERICRDLVEQDPNDVEAMLLLGLALGISGKPQLAAPILNRVAALRSEFAHPCADLAQLMAAQAKTYLVVPQYQHCLALTPCDRRLCFSFADYLREQGDGAAALRALEPLLSENDAELHYQVGLALAEAGQFAEAAERFQMAIVNDPRPAAFWANLGMMLKVEGRFDAALDAYEQALVRAPNDQRIRGNRAVALLQAGRLTEAWQDEDWQPDHTMLPPETLLPAISRLPDLSGRTVLVVHEEGFGDTLQFLRYLPLLAKRGARVAVAVPPPLTRLLRSVPGVSDVPDGDAAVPEHDFHCSFNGLPRAFETTLDTIPHNVPYLAADPGMARQWAARLPDNGALRVGLCWAGQARPWLPGFSGLDYRRSTRLATLAPLALVSGLQFVSLQKGPASEEVPTAGFALLDVMNEVHDFADTAALVANLDLVISVDTSVVHLAGALGKPVFLLDRYDNCWRWLSGRENSPWYPTLRIFRQLQSGDWGSVIAGVATALEDLSISSRGIESSVRNRRCKPGKRPPS
jgi:Flp pilus assembly protein TadD/ADP-heptose:LPS heptosyltransferase